ncbi:unknown protein [Desulfotalea psychrophila LSv54]|uniref:Uncharacterized protein n=1 Tax=Desulfotalea psychrophila (strain LSv54 / DSM 12343) TaxID=177439 RepID=Q6ALK8_DESPS|nr:unknown protein [Desulfotalea psychrophila LSv54]
MAPMCTTGTLKNSCSITKQPSLAGAVSFVANRLHRRSLSGRFACNLNNEIFDFHYCPCRAALPYQYHRKNGRNFYCNHIRTLKKYTIPSLQRFGITTRLPGLTFWVQNILSLAALNR